MLEVFQDLHDEDGVIIKIVEETAAVEKCFDISNEDLSGYMIWLIGIGQNLREK